MGLLHMLWDDAFAGGPPPDSGLGKLRFSAAAAPPRSAAVPRGAGLVSRRVTIVRTGSPGGGAVCPDSVPEPPARCGSSDPGTPPPSPGTQQGDFKKFTRRKSSQALQKAEPRSPTVFDWILISALDR
ncbi:dormancy-associated protein homolog 4-like [Syzygium oleosum]|uniref:dormancy-associated protein homolog 4-like n=1 Tax=Syzygium oleosum TaxID=219896 RepID=UPI0024BB2E8D|nr:dormancy-associated protein homolog 4-like [Syzygium oleosum]